MRCKSPTNEAGNFYRPVVPMKLPHKVGRIAPVVVVVTQRGLASEGASERNTSDAEPGLVSNESLRAGAKRDLYEALCPRVSYSMASISLGKTRMCA